MDTQRILSIQQDERAGQRHHAADFQYIENQAEFFTTLRRRPHVLAINNTNILNDTTVLTLRYGWQTWRDQTDTATFGPGLGSLGFALQLRQRRQRSRSHDVPELLFDDIDDVGEDGAAIAPLDGTIRHQRHARRTDGRAQPQVRR